MNPPFPRPQVYHHQGLHIYQAEPVPTAPVSPPLPSYWRNDFVEHYGLGIGRPLEVLFAALCLVSVGRDSLSQKWQELHNGEERYKAHIDRIVYRLTSMTTMIGLLLASMAALITTTAPKSNIIDYTMRGPYICLWASFGILLGAAIVGSAVLFVMSACTSEWIVEVLMASRLRVICILITLGYPFLAVGTSTLVCAFGLLGAAWHSNDDIARDGFLFLILAPLAMAFLFILCVFPTKKDASQETASLMENGAASAR